MKHPVGDGVVEDPFATYPDFGRVLDEMAKEGLHLYYHRIRTTFKDDGTRWREKWEIPIRTWMRKARIWDTFSEIFDKGVLSVPHARLKELETTLDDRKLIKILERIREAFQAQKDLADLQSWLMLNEKINHHPRFARFIKEILTEWKISKGEASSPPFFEVAPKGTMEKLRELERVLQFIEGTNPMGRMDGLPVHCSEVLEYLRLWLRSILGLPTDLKNLWSDRDVMNIHGWTGMGRDQGVSGRRADPAVVRA